MDDEPFNPDYVEVDRVLDESESTDENGEVCSFSFFSTCSLWPLNGLKLDRFGYVLDLSLF